MTVSTSKTSLQTPLQFQLVADAQVNASLEKGAQDKASVDFSNLPPMLRQYREYKQNYPDCIIFFQVGDFYETFFEDAELVATTLQLTLTSRDKTNANPIPMCGVPISVIENYIAKLVNVGHSVAQISQVGEAVGTKGGVTRALERIVTPGMRLLSNEDDLATPYVAAIIPAIKDDGAIAYSDIQSGRIFYCDSLSNEQLTREISRISPSELIFPQKFADRILDRRNSLVQQLERSARAQTAKFRSNQGKFQQKSKDLVKANLNARQAISLLYEFISEVSVNSEIKISEIIEDRASGEMVIDATTRANLEITANARDGTIHGSLFGAVNRCASAAGSRLLRNWLLRPSSNLNEILRRQSAVTTFLENQLLKNELRADLRRSPDLERLATRAELSRISPRELGVLRDALLHLPKIIAGLMATDCEMLKTLAGDCRVEPKLALELDRCLLDELPQQLGAAPFVRERIDAELDRLRSLQTDGRSWMSEFEQKERIRSGISSLKIKANGVFGYFIEVTKSNLDRVPKDYVRKQTTANGERYVTEELRQRERDLNNAEASLLKIERSHFQRLCQLVVENSEAIRVAGRALAQLDVLAALAELAENEGYVAPLLHEQASSLIEDARHPVLAQLLRHDFVSNSLQLGVNHERCAVVSGPNMGGKSTFLRQTALISILAQIGSYVPASRAELGIVDRVFARIGASDNLVDGESTFLVEMREASQIISQASERSLVLVDELGRGTATADGLAIARAVLEWLCTQTKARTLFATHFHELTMLTEALEGAFNLSVVAIQKENKVIFTHQIARGAAGKSYGIEVAELAGLPPSLLARARQLLRESESNAVSMNTTVSDPRQLNIFEKSENVHSGAPQTDPALLVLHQHVSTLDPDGMTPKDALKKLYELREIVNTSVDN